MPWFKPQRQARYERLREAHFTGKEAREFSKLNRKYPALVQVMATRRAQWANFKGEAKRKGWIAPAKLQKEWGNKLAGFYSQKRFEKGKDKSGVPVTVFKDWVVTKNVHGQKIKPSPSPWEWYDAVFKRLPDELKWDTPRSHRSKQTDVMKLDKVMASRWIAQLQTSMKRATKATDKARFKTQIDNIRRNMRKK